MRGGGGEAQHKVEGDMFKVLAVALAKKYPSLLFDYISI